MSDDESSTPLATKPSPSDSQKEQIKLMAAYFNGIAVGIALVGGLSLPATIALNAKRNSDIVFALALGLLSFVASPYIHSYAKRILKRLDP